MIQATHLPPQAAVERFLEQGWRGMRTFGDILEARARTQPDHVAFIDARLQVTYGALWSQVRRFADRLPFDRAADRRPAEGQ